MKFRYTGEPIYDIGLLLEKRTGSDIEINNIVHFGDIITTTDEKCIKIMKSNPHYELIKEKPVKKETIKEEPVEKEPVEKENKKTKKENKK